MEIGIGKRAVSLLLALLLAVGAAFSLAPQADAAEPEVSAPAAVLMEFSSGEVLYERGAHDKRPCASITKVMTLLLVFEAIENGQLDYDTVLSASAHAAGMGGSDIWLKEGEQMTVDDLIKACVVMSANDAAVVLAEAVAGSEDAFVERMNTRAAALGMEDTTFKNCNGLDEEGHITSAYDVAVMSRALMQHERIFDYTTIWIDYVRNGETQLVNTNKLVRSYNGIKGLKTGTTSAAGSCVSACAERDGMTLISVILGAGSTDERFDSAAALLDFGFANWKTITPELPELPVMPVTKGMVNEVALSALPPVGVLVPTAGENTVDYVFSLPESVEAPVYAGQEIGKLQVTLNGEVVQELPVTAAESVEPITFLSALRWLWDCFLLKGTVSK